MTNILKLTTGAAITLASVMSANAALVNAGSLSGGSVTLVANGVVIDTAAGSSGIAGASDGVTTFGSNGQLFTDGRNGPSGDFFATGAPLVFDIDLGSQLDLDSIAFFNRDSNPNRNAVSGFSAIFSTDNVYDGADTDTGLLSPLNIGPAQQDFALGSVVTARYVRVTISDNFFEAGQVGGGDRVGFNDIQFNVVPEPSSTALLGLGGLALILRRRK